MGFEAVIETRIDSELKDRAAAVLEELGLTVSDAVRLLLTHVADEGSFPLHPAIDAGHDAWFRAQVQEALDDPTPGLPESDVERYFARRREAALRKAGSTSP